MTFEELYARVEAALSSSDLGRDRLLPSKVCVALCELLTLTDSQRAGVEDAKRFHGAISDAERLVGNERLSRELDEFARRGEAKSSEEAVQRLAWASLVTTEGMSPSMGEFLVWVAQRAGLSADQIAGVFHRLIPSFPTTAS